MGDNPSVLVNARNHEWAAEQTGYSQREIAQFYQDAQDAGVVCVVEQKDGFGIVIHNIFEEEADGSTAEASSGGSSRPTWKRESSVGWRGIREDGNGSRLLLD